MSIIGLDVGTSRVKAVRFGHDWTAKDAAAENSAVRRMDGGRREQDMDEVWAAAARVLAAVTARSPEKIEAVAITAQGDGCWLLAADARPAAPAMLWNDSRAASIVDRWQREGRLEDAFRINGCQAAPGLAHAQLCWLREHQPEVLARARTLTSCAGWIYTCLTGRVVVDATDAANPFFDARAGQYSPALLELFGLGDLERLLPHVATDSDLVTPVLTDIATEIGLDPDVHIVLAPYDVPATAIGTAAVRAGRGFAVLGTTLCVGSVSDDPQLDRAPNGMTLPGANPGQWLIAYATMNGTEVLDWASSMLGCTDAAGVVALAARSRRADPPLFLPYLSPAGERSPFLDTAIRGSVSGLDSGHTPADVARSVVDGLSLAVVECLNAGVRPEQLVICGGGATSDLWCQTIADAAEITVRRSTNTEVGALGAALTAAHRIAGRGSLPELADSAMGAADEFTPQPPQVHRYRELYGRFRTERQQQQHKET